MGGGGPERVRERTEGVLVFVNGTWTGGAAGTVPVLSDVLGMGFAERRWIGVSAAVGPVFLGAAAGVGIDRWFQIANCRWQIWVIWVLGLGGLIIDY